MSEPTQMADLPDTRLDEARHALFQALERVWEALGWPADRAEEYPPRELVAPSAFVDVPTMHQAPTEQVRTIAATFPVVFVVDGDEQAQVQQQDKLMAYGWQELTASGAGQHVIVQTAGPEDVDVGGVTTRGLVFRVQVSLQTKTLCRQPLVQPETEGNP
jgi:hypothetical protein